jgi:hypothetical protein
MTDSRESREKVEFADSKYAKDTSAIARDEFTFSWYARLSNFILAKLKEPRIFPAATSKEKWTVYKNNLRAYLHNPFSRRRSKNEGPQECSQFKEVQIVGKYDYRDPPPMNFPTVEQFDDILREAGYDVDWNKKKEEPKDGN